MEQNVNNLQINQKTPLQDPFRTYSIGSIFAKFGTIVLNHYAWLRYIWKTRADRRRPAMVVEPRDMLAFSSSSVRTATALASAALAANRGERRSCDCCRIVLSEVLMLLLFGISAVRAETLI